MLAQWGSWTNETTKWCTAKIALDICVDSPEWPEIVHRAQKIWLETWGPARKKGYKHFIGQRSKKTAQITETGWRRKRAACIESHVASKPSKSRSQVLQDATASGLPAWTDSHSRREAKLLQRQRDDKALATLGDGVLLPHEISASDLARSAVLGEKRRKADMEHDRTKRKKQADVSRPQTVDLDSVPIHCSPDLPSDVRRICMDYIVEKRGVTVSTDNLQQAAMFVTSDPGRPNESQRMIASLLGGAIICPLYLLSAGAKGARVWHGPAVKTPRRLYMSIGFIQNHAVLSGCIAAAVYDPSSKWKIIDTLADFRRHCATDAARPPRSRRPLDVIALLTDAEAHAEGLHGQRNVFSELSLDAFHNLVIALDASRSACGTAML